MQAGTLLAEREARYREVLTKAAGGAGAGGGEGGEGEGGDAPAEGAGAAGAAAAGAAPKAKKVKLDDDDPLFIIPVVELHARFETLVKTALGGDKECWKATKVRLRLQVWILCAARPLACARVCAWVCRRAWRTW